MSARRYSSTLVRVRDVQLVLLRLRLGDFRVGETVDGRVDKSWKKGRGAKERKELQVWLLFIQFQEIEASATAIEPEISGRQLREVNNIRQFATASISLNCTST